MKTITKQLWLAVLLAIAGLQFSIAQTLDPQPPRNLSAQVTTSPNGGTILLKWQSAGIKPDGFNVYSAFNDVQGTPMYRITGSILSQNNDSLGWYFYSIPVYTTGIYSMYVTAFGNMKESGPSNVVNVSYKADNTPSAAFQFQSAGSWLAAKNVPYSYDANVQMRTSTTSLINVPEDGQSVKYSLEKAPAGMTIDAQTGQLTWTPTATGEYFVYVVATVQFQGAQARLSQSLQISVRNCAQVTTLAGFVNDENGVAIEKGYVMIMSSKSSDSLNRNQVYTAEIRGGSYGITVDEGTFYLQAGGGDFDAEWYQDSPIREKAMPVTLVCGDTVMANFVVSRHPAPKLYTVRGMVTDKVTGEPISSAMIEFSNPKGTRINTTQITATTDAKGAYTVQLPGDQLFVARCTAGVFDPTTGIMSYTYFPQYYREVSLLTEATLINPVSSSAAMISFRLIRKTDEQFKGQIRGTLVASDGHILAGKVMAFPVKDTRSEVLTTDVLIDGTYNFTNVATGNYVLFALATQESYVPGFYRAGRSATLSWGEATVISVGLQSTSPTYTITLDPLSAIKGKGRIRGTIGKGKGIAKGDSPLAADPLSGAMVYAIDANGRVSAYSWSDGNGAFETSELPKGKYTLVASKIGYKEYTAEVEIVDEDITTETNVELSTADPSGVAEDTFVNSAVVFPNPATETISVEFTGEGATSLQVMNMLGGEVHSATLVARGHTRYTFSGTSLPTGRYFVKITTGSTVTILPVSLMK
ncbi:MAG: carboxypeptidase regulatory-like domain-containing protein [Candidatus Kapaibacterium sp.]